MTYDTLLIWKKQEVKKTDFCPRHTFLCRELTL